MIKPLTDAALIHERCGLAVEQDRPHDCIDALKAEVERVNRDMFEMDTRWKREYNSYVLTTSRLKAKLDAVRELPEKWETDRKIESHDGYNAGYNDGRVRAAVELQAVLDG